MLRCARSRSAVVAIIATGLLVVACARGAPGCVQCGRPECKNLAFTVHREDGAVVRTCCPRCALRYVAEERPEVARLTVRDFATARELDARAAVYVEGSEIHPCSETHGPPPQDARGCCLKAVYDRCLPSVLAFVDRAQAEAFAREHGGFVTAFEALEAAERERVSQMRHPAGS